MRFRPSRPLDLAAVPAAHVPTDADLAAAARAGDREAFDALVERHAARLFRFLRMRAPCAQAAEELVQDTFVQCWRTLAKFDVSRSFSTWLYKLGSNLAASRARRARLPTAELGEQPAGPDPAAVACERDARANLWDVVLAELPPEARTSMWLFYGEGRSSAEIGEILGKSDGAVRILLLRARTRLAAVLPPDLLPVEAR